LFIGTILLDDVDPFDWTTFVRNVDDSERASQRSIANSLFGPFSIRDDRRYTYLIELLGELVTSFVSYFFSQVQIPASLDLRSNFVSVFIRKIASHNIR